LPKKHLVAAQARINEIPKYFIPAKPEWKLKTNELPKEKT
jgi:hypothetical protein